MTRLSLSLPELRINNFRNKAVKQLTHLRLFPPAFQINDFPGRSFKEASQLSTEITFRGTPALFRNLQMSGSYRAASAGGAPTERRLQRGSHREAPPGLLVQRAFPESLHRASHGEAAAEMSFLNIAQLLLGCFAMIISSRTHKFTIQD